MSDAVLARAPIRPVRKTTPLLTAFPVIAARCLRLSRRNTDALLTSLILPVILMVMFVYLFGGAISTGTSVSYVDYVVPGVLLLCAGFGAASTAVSVCQDLTGGMIDRLRSLDVPGAAVLGGQVAASLARNTVSTALVFGIAFALGFRTSAGAAGLLGVAGILVLFLLAISWLAAVAGLLARSAEAANGFTFFVMFLPYASSTFVPIASMPSWLAGFARNQPVTPVVETLRGLLLGTPVGAAPWRAIAWCGGILLASVLASGVLFRRRIR
jgi:ABC-2 type transport system permease protein